MCRGLFDAHKLVFSLLIAIAIQRDAGLVSSAEWDFFLRGSQSSSGNSHSTSSSNTGSKHAQLANPAPDWLLERTWQGLKALAAAAPVFADLPTALAANPGLWQPLLLGAQREIRSCGSGGGRDPSAASEAGMAVGWSKAALDHMAQLWGAPSVLTAFQRLLLTKVRLQVTKPDCFMAAQGGSSPK